MNYIKALQNRYACKAMNGEKIADEQREKILEAIRLTPTSLGFQPFKLYVIKSQEILDKLSSAVNNQPQIKMSDSVIVFATLKSYNEKDVDEYIQRVATIRGLASETLYGFKDMVKGFTGNLSPEEFQTWTKKQSYIALGNGLFAAALENIDSVPMEGFKANEVDELLNLGDLNLTSSVLLTLGIKDKEKDYLFGQAKVRKSKDEFIVEL